MLYRRFHPCQGRRLVVGPGSEHWLRCDLYMCTYIRGEVAAIGNESFEGLGRSQRQSTLLAMLPHSCCHRPLRTLCYKRGDCPHADPCGVSCCWCIWCKIQGIEENE